MNTGVYEFVLDQSVPLLDAEMSLHLAMVSAEGLHGEAQVRMEAGYHVDEDHRLLIVDGSTDVGLTVVRIFTGLLLRQYGAASFEVRKMQGGMTSPATPSYAGAA